MPKKRSFKHMRAVEAQLPVQFQEGAMVVKGEELIRLRGAVGKAPAVLSRFDSAALVCLLRDRAAVPQSGTAAAVAQG